MIAACLNPVLQRPLFAGWQAIGWNHLDPSVSVIYTPCVSTCLFLFFFLVASLGSLHVAHSYLHYCNKVVLGLSNRLAVCTAVEMSARLLHACCISLYIRLILTLLINSPPP